MLLFLQILQDSSGKSGLVVTRRHGVVDLDLCRGIEDPTTYFRDGLRKIDFVLVWEERTAGEEAEDKAMAESGLQGSVRVAHLGNQ